jgi:hypothetical protein
MRVGIGIISLGVAPLLEKMSEGPIIRSMDEAGILTRSGKMIAWADVTHVRREINRMEGSGRILTDQLVFSTKQGKALLPIWRAEQAEVLVDFALRRVPPGALERTTR